MSVTVTQQTGTVEQIDPNLIVFEDKIRQIIPRTWTPKASCGSGTGSAVVERGTRRRESVHAWKQLAIAGLSVSAIAKRIGSKTGIHRDGE